MAESRIGDQAIEFLGSYYAKHEKKSGLLLNRNVSTLQGTVADALFAYQKHDNCFFAVSLNTAASTKLARLLSSYKKRGLGRSRYLTAASVLGTAAYLCFLTGNWLALAILPAALAALVFFVHSRLCQHYMQQQLKEAVDQLKQQPGDHQWLGIQVSSLCWRGNAMANYLSKVCERKGIGLLTIGKRSRLTLRQEPRLATCRRTDFLSYYTQGESMRRELSDQFMRVA
ncbi:hypothetical protein [Pontibacter ramchanderi]|uniref:Uncharacterized protein n=1 Tax=Pontibacter ramchanderi TaxID=1179743 RepID=A0A2N3U938_9BACT|nr:hypothetical protein [Pontibacter ramchanderi]PKV63273.1 hypothetical protein BD749_3113 [Pontibacter ramchanderi]